MIEKWIRRRLDSDTDRKEKRYWLLFCCDVTLFKVQDTKHVIQFERQLENYKHFSRHIK